MTSVAVSSGLARADAAAALRVIGFWALLSGVLVASLLVSLASGRYHVPVGHVVAMLWSDVAGSQPTWTATESMVVHTVRLPRILMAALAGAGLSLCGGVLQGMFRNPLVGPQTIGASSGAALGGAVAILIFGFGWAVEIGAFMGAAAALFAVLLLHRGDGLSSILALVLAGVVISAFCGAIVGLATYLADPETKLPGLVFWLLGSFAAATWPKLALLAIVSVPAILVLLGMRWRVNVLSLGDEEARSLGVHPGRDRLILLGAVCLAVSAQVAAPGLGPPDR